MKNIYRSITVLLITACAVVSIAAECSDSEKTALKNTDNAWHEAWLKRDKAAADKLLSSDYSIYFMANSLDKEWVTQDWDGTPRNLDFSIARDFYFINCSSNFASMTHRVEFTGPRGAFYRRDVHTFEKKDGRWQVLSEANHNLSDGDWIRYKEVNGRNMFLKRNTEWFSKNLHEDYVSVDMNGVVRNKSEALEEIKESKITYDKLDITRMRVSVDGDTARTVINYRAAGKDADGKPFESNALISRTLVRRDGKWLVLSSHGSRLAENQ